MLLRISSLARVFRPATDLARTQAGLIAAYGTYRAVPKSLRGSLSAYSPDGDLVVSLWESQTEAYEERWLTFSGTLQYWYGPGVAEIRERIQEAFLSDRTVRLVVARTADAAARHSAPDGSRHDTTFHAKPDWRGRVMSFDGDRYVMSFCRAADARSSYSRRRIDRWQAQPAPVVQVLQEKPG